MFSNSVTYIINNSLMGLKCSQSAQKCPLLQQWLARQWFSFLLFIQFNFSHESEISFATHASSIVYNTQSQATLQAFYTFVTIIHTFIWFSFQILGLILYQCTIAPVLYNLWGLNLFPGNDMYTQYFMGNMWRLSTPSDKHPFIIRVS